MVSMAAAWAVFSTAAASRCHRSQVSCFPVRPLVPWSGPGPGWSQGHHLRGGQEGAAIWSVPERSQRLCSGFTRAAVVNSTDVTGFSSGLGRCSVRPTVSRSSALTCAVFSAAIWAVSSPVMAVVLKARTFVVLNWLMSVVSMAAAWGCCSARQLGGGHAGHPRWSGPPRIAVVVPEPGWLTGQGLEPWSAPRSDPYRCVDGGGGQGANRGGRHGRQVGGFNRCGLPCSGSCRLGRGQGTDLSRGQWRLARWSDLSGRWW